MTRAAKSIYYFGFYLIGLGILVTFFPNTMLETFFLPPATDVFIRVTGVLVFNIGLYYVVGAPSNYEPFLRISILTRCIVLVSFIAFVLLGFAKPALIPLGVVDVLGAMWTWWELRKS
jgi:hypothetical protein